MTTKARTKGLSNFEKLIILAMLSACIFVYVSVADSATARQLSNGQSPTKLCQDTIALNMPIDTINKITLNGTIVRENGNSKKDQMENIKTACAADKIEIKLQVLKPKLAPELTNETTPTELCYEQIAHSAPAGTVEQITLNDDLISDVRHHRKDRLATIRATCSVNNTEITLEIKTKSVSGIMPFQLPLRHIAQADRSFQLPLRHIAQADRSFQLPLRQYTRPEIA